MDPLFLPVEVTIDEDVFDACRGWLRYFPVDQDFGPVKISKISDVMGGKSEGIFGPTLRELQFYWALRKLEPFLATAGMARKQFRRSSEAIFFLHQNYREEWDGWRTLHEERPFHALLDHIAERMAETLGSDIY